jgi:two-component system, NarL family, invasion response regulator UvrY
MNILIADDHSIVRSGLKILIGKDFTAEIDEAADGNEVTALIKKKKYELAILDINMPNTNSPQLVEYMRSQQQHIKILIFSMNSEHIYARRYFKMGVNGFLSKEAPDAEIPKAIQTVLSGKRYVSQKVTDQLMNEALYGSKENPFDNLSAREFEVASFLLQGKALNEITSIINVHSSTIGTHKAHIFEKLMVNNIIELNELAKLYGME